MKKLFHTEDCGLSLICRCCRRPVCERNLAKADRMRIQRELWSHEDRSLHYGSPPSRAKRCRQQFVRLTLTRLFTRLSCRIRNLERERSVP